MKKTYTASKPLMHAYHNVGVLNLATRRATSMMIGLLRAGLLDVVHSDRETNQHTVRRVPLWLWKRRRQRHMQRKARRIMRQNRK